MMIEYRIRYHYPHVRPGELIEYNTKRNEIRGSTREKEKHNDEGRTRTQALFLGDWIEYGSRLSKEKEEEEEEEEEEDEEDEEDEISYFTSRTRQQDKAELTSQRARVHSSNA